MARKKPPAITKADIRQQLAEDLDWYDRNATRNRDWYWVLVAAGLALGIMVTISGGAGWPAIVTFLLGIAVTAATTVLSISQVRANSVRFRMTHGALQSEVLLWSAGAGGYMHLNDEDGLQRLTLRRNAIVGSEYGQWESLATTRDASIRKMLNVDGGAGARPEGDAPANGDAATPVTPTGG